MSLDLPDLSKMPPEDWLRQLDQIREHLITEVADLLRETDDPETLADALDDAFSQLRRDHTGGESLAVEVELDGDDIICRNRTAETARRLRLDEANAWRVELEADRQLERDTDSTANHTDHHRRLARRLLELLPWWSKHAFTPQSRT